MASVSNKILEFFRYLKSDAVPRPPRQQEEPPQPPSRDQTSEPEADDPPRNTKESGDESDHEEIIFNEDDFDKEDFMQEKKSKFKFPFQTKKGKDDPKDPKKPNKGEKNSNSVNTQATGSVFTIMNSSGVQVGSNHVYYMSATNGTAKTGPNDHIKKDNLITLLMEATIPLEYRYIYFISQNLGKDWQNFFVTLGFTEGKVETFEIQYGIIEARKKLLIDWAENDKDGSLGHIATLLWEEGERQIVRELSLIYKENKKL